MSGQSGSTSGGRGGGDTVRKTWNKDEYLQRIKDRKNERKDAEKSIQVKTPLGLAQARGEIELDLNLNKTYIVDDIKTPGYTCYVCSLTFKDNLSWLDHLNHPIHLRNLGQSGKVARSTVEEVRAHLLALKEKKVVLDPKERMELNTRNAEDAKRRRKEDKREKKRIENISNDGFLNDQSDVSALMGFEGFTTSKR